MPPPVSSLLWLRPNHFVSFHKPSVTATPIFFFLPPLRPTPSHWPNNRPQQLSPPLTLTRNPLSLPGCPTQLLQPVVICGFGPQGQMLANLLENPLVPASYIAFDSDPQRVQASRGAAGGYEFGIPIALLPVPLQFRLGVRLAFLLSPATRLLLLLCLHLTSPCRSFLPSYRPGGKLASPLCLVTVRGPQSWRQRALRTRVPSWSAIGTRSRCAPGRGGRGRSCAPSWSAIRTRSSIGEGQGGSCAFLVSHQNKEQVHAPGGTEAGLYGSGSRSRLRTSSTCCS